MNHAKRIISFLVAAIVIVLSAEFIYPAVPVKADIVPVTSGDWEYEINYDELSQTGSVIIMGYKGSATSITIPSKLGGYNVWRIGDNAFSSSKVARKITSVKFPNGITSIGAGAFSGCSSLKNITWGTGLELIFEKAFENCTGLTSVKIPEGVRYIYNYAFSGCSNIKTLTIPKSIKAICAGAFDNLKNLTRINFNGEECSLVGYGGSTGISGPVFSNAGITSGSVSVVFGDSVKSIPMDLFSSSGSVYPRITSVQISDSVTRIWDDAFYNCRKLKTIKWGANVDYINSNAFSYCTALTDFYIPATVKTIERFVLTGCTNLQTVVFPEDITFEQQLPSYDFIIKDCPKLKNVVVCSSTLHHILDMSDDTWGDITFYCYEDSWAESFAQQNDFKVKYLTRDHYFSDVPPTHSFQAAIYWASDEGIVAGYKNGLFGSDDAVTRGQVALFLWRAADQPKAKDLKTQSFSDVKTTSAFYKAIQWAVEEGITAGYSDGTFRPSENCTRGQIAQFLWRYAGKPAPQGKTQTFSDVPTSHGFYKAVQWASEQGITAGYKDGTFGVNKSCTRGHCVTFLYRLSQIK